MQNRPKRKSKAIEILSQRDIANYQVMVNSNLRRHIAYGLLIQFILNALGALAVIFMVGFGLMSLSEKIILAVIAETITQTAAMFFTVTRHFFPARKTNNE